MRKSARVKQEQQTDRRQESVFWLRWVNTNTCASIARMHKDVETKRERKNWRRKPEFEKRKTSDFYSLLMSKVERCASASELLERHPELVNGRAKSKRTKLSEQENAKRHTWTPNQKVVIVCCAFWPVFALSNRACSRVYCVWVQFLFFFLSNSHRWEMKCSLICQFSAASLVRSFAFWFIHLFIQAKRVFHFLVRSFPFIRCHQIFIAAEATNRRYECDCRRQVTLTERDRMCTNGEMKWRRRKTQKKANTKFIKTRMTTLWDTMQRKKIDDDDSDARRKENRK